jgi:hypothetical protein
MMPGAFGKGTTEALLTWVRDHGYESARISRSSWPSA